MRRITNQATPAAGTNGHAAAPPANGHATVPSADGDNGAHPTGKDGRTGQFLPGNKLGKGNPHYRKLAANRAAFLEAVGPEQVKRLAADLLRRALEGDVDAAKLVLSYAIGRAVEPADADRADLNEVSLLLASPSLPEMHAALLRHFPPALVAELAREAAPTDVGQLWERLDALRDAAD